MLSISSRLPLLLATFAALGMIFATALQVYGFWRIKDAAVGRSVPSATTGSQRPGPQEPDIKLASVSLFGDPDQKRAAPEEDIDNLPETNLQLVLRGVMAASGDFPGSALVEDNQRQTEAYIVGDDLPGNASLRKVRPDRIIIERGGVLENLFFPDEENRSGMALAATGADESEPDYGEQEARPASFSGPETAGDSDGRRKEIRQRLEQLRNRLRNN